MPNNTFYQMQPEERCEKRPRITPQSRRHATPAGPWPWMDFDLQHESQPPHNMIYPNSSKPWSHYPQSCFPNWTPSQVERSGIAKAIRYIPMDGSKDTPSKIYRVDVGDSGKFEVLPAKIIYSNQYDDLYAELEQMRDIDIRSRVYILEKLSGPVLQMLGTTYKIEPFFWSSALHWIPSHYQEDMKTNQGDHITITLTYLRKRHESDPKINREPELHLPRESLVLDLLAVHMVRNRESGTIISFHPPEYRSGSAKYLHSRIWEAGGSVYWQHIYRNTKDPTFILLAFLWQVMYAWDEALELLYSHINNLEPDIPEMTDVLLTRELHHLRAHLLNYDTLLRDFRNAVQFVLDTPNPAMASSRFSMDRYLMDRECNNLLDEVDRLQEGRELQDRRLKNVMELVFKSVNIEDSRHMKELNKLAVRDSAVMKEMTQIVVRDSAALKQVAYLTMIFLPATVVAGVFGMNVKEINPEESNHTLVHYFVVAVPLMVLTIWVFMAFQRREYFERIRPTIWRRLLWPIILIRQWWRR